MNSGSNDNTTDTHNTDATVVVVDCDAIISLFVPNKTDRKQRDLIVLCFVLLFAFIILCMTWRQMQYQRNHPAPTVPFSEDEDGNSNSTADDKTTDNEADDIRKKIQSFTSNDWIRLYHTVFDSNEHQIILTSAHMVPDSNSNNTNRSDHTSNDMMEEKEDTHYFIGSIDIELGIRNSSSSSSGGGHTIYGTAQHEVEEEEEEDAHNIVNESNPPSAKNSYDTTIEEEQKRGKQNHYSSVVGIDIELGNNTTRTSTSSANLDEGIAVGVDTPSRNHIQEFVDNNDDDDDEGDNSDNTKTVLSSSLSSPILSVWPLKEKRCVICLENFQIGDTVVWSSDNQQHDEKLHRNNDDGGCSTTTTTTTTMDANSNSYRCHHVFHKVCMVNFLASNGQRRIRSDQPILSRTIPGNNEDSINPCPTCRRNFCSVTPNACMVVLQTAII